MMGEASRRGAMLGWATHDKHGQEQRGGAPFAEDTAPLPPLPLPQMGLPLRPPTAHPPSPARPHPRTHTHPIRCPDQPSRPPTQPRPTLTRWTNPSPTRITLRRQSPAPPFLTRVTFESFTETYMKLTKFRCPPPFLTRATDF